MEGICPPSFLEVNSLKNVKMLVSMAGHDISLAPGDVIEVSDEIAEAWQGAEIAVIVKRKAAVNDGD